jgi:hypothetical protein
LADPFAGLPPYPNWQRKRIQIPFSVSSSLTGGTVTLRHFVPAPVGLKVLEFGAGPRLLACGVTVIGRSPCELGFPVTAACCTLMSSSGVIPIGVGLTHDPLRAVVVEKRGQRAIQDNRSLWAVAVA